MIKHHSFHTAPVDCGNNFEKCLPILSKGHSKLPEAVHFLAGYGGRLIIAVMENSAAPGTATDKNCR
jgi:hypothetical protein